MVHCRLQYINTEYASVLNFTSLCGRNEITQRVFSLVHIYNWVAFAQILLKPSLENKAYLDRYDCAILSISIM